MNDIEWSAIFATTFDPSHEEEREDMENVKNLDPTLLMRCLEKTIENFDKFIWSLVDSEVVFDYVTQMNKEIKDDWKGVESPFDTFAYDSKNYGVKIDIDLDAIRDNSMAIFCYLMILRGYLPCALETQGLDVDDSFWFHLDGTEKIAGLDSSSEDPEDSDGDIQSLIEDIKGLSIDSESDSLSDY